MTLLIILAIVALLVLWVIGVQRKLVEKDGCDGICANCAMNCAEKAGEVAEK